MPSILSNVTDVPTAGTAVQISNTPRRVMSITFFNPEANTGLVYVGNDGTSTPDVSATTGPSIPRGKSITVKPSEFNVTVPISDFWIDAEISGNDVAWIAIMET